MTLPFSVRDALRWTGGELLSGDPDARLSGVSIDTRTLQPGALFVAIRGPRHDAHDFLAAARERGAGGLLIERGRRAPSQSGDERPVVAAGDTTRALGALAAGHRTGFDGPVIAITGSNGKTTTKEMCASILGTGGPCLKSRGNLNNEFGLPLSLLERDAGHRAVVVEIGMNHPGEIAPLAALARPTVAVVTNAGTAHLEFLGTRDAVAREKGALLEALDESGTAVLNADDRRVMAQAGRCRGRVVTFGRAAGADVRAAAPTPRCDGSQAFELRAPGGRVPVRVAGIGESAVANALAAAAAAIAAGAELDAVRAGLAAWRPVAGRMQCRRLPGGVVLVDDSYNANPESLALALRSLAARRGAGRAIAVLGDMGELGAAAPAAHRRGGALAAELGFAFLVAVGAHAPEVRAGALRAGMDPAQVFLERDPDAAGVRARELARREDWVLVKGSRAAQMDRAARALEAAEPEKERA